MCVIIQKLSLMILHSATLMEVDQIAFHTFEHCRRTMTDDKHSCNIFIDTYYKINKEWQSSITHNVNSILKDRTSILYLIECVLLCCVILDLKGYAPQPFWPCILSCKKLWYVNEMYCWASYKFLLYILLSVYCYVASSLIWKIMRHNPYDLVFEGVKDCGI